MRRVVLLRVDFVTFSSSIYVQYYYCIAGIIVSAFSELFNRCKHIFYISASRNQ
jgi:hypothetical protein